MDGLAEFLAARLDEERQRAGKMRHSSVDEPFYDCPATRTGPLGDLPWGEDACTCGLARRKARALREVEAKRAILAELQAQNDGDPWGDPWSADADYIAGLAFAASALAAVYSDHPDYREWKP